MQLTTITLFLASALTASAHPFNLSPRTANPEHGVCALKLELMETLPRLPVSSAQIQLRVTDNSQSFPGLTTASWSNGEPIHFPQRITSENSITLHHLIEWDSQLQITWDNSTGPVYPIVMDGLSFVYTRAQDGFVPELGEIKWHDVDGEGDVLWAQCMREELWKSYDPATRQARTVECTLYC
jgi:hypothetical protein